MWPRSVHIPNVAKSAENFETGHCPVGLSRGLAGHQILERGRCVVVWLFRVRIGDGTTSVQFDTESGLANTQYHKCWRTRNTQWKMVRRVPWLYQEVPGEGPGRTMDYQSASLQTRLPRKYECHRVEGSLAEWPQRLLSASRRADGNRRRLICDGLICDGARGTKAVTTKHQSNPGNVTNNLQLKAGLEYAINLPPKTNAFKTTQSNQILLTTS